jgi:hypothetical protein
MRRIPRKPTAPRPHGAVGAVAATLARRKAAREPRVVLTDAGGQPRTLARSDPAARSLLEAAERLISAVQRGSDAK